MPSIDSKAVEVELESVIKLQDSAWAVMFSNLDLAESLIWEVLQEAEQLPDTVHANSLNHLAIALSFRGETEASLERFEQALLLCDGAPRRKFIIQRNYAMVLKSARKYDEALKATEEALAFWTKEGNANEVGRAYATLGNIYELLEDYEKSSKYLLQAIAAFDPNDDEHLRTLGSMANNLGIVCLKAGDVDAAVQYHDQAARYLEGAGRTQQALQAQLNVVGCYMFLHDTTNFATSLSQAETWAEAWGPTAEPSAGRLASFQAVNRYWQTGETTAFEEVWDRYQHVMYGKLGHVLEWGRALIETGEGNAVPDWADAIVQEHPELEFDVREDLESLPALVSEVETGWLATALQQTVEIAQDRLMRNAGLLRARFQVEQLEDQIQTSATENALLKQLNATARQRTIGWALGLGGLALAALALAWLFRQKRQLEVQRAQEEAESARRLLDEGMRDLAIQTLKHSELHKQVFRTIERLEEHGTPTALIAPLRSLHSFDAKRQEFQAAFAKLFPRFEAQIQAAHPQISPAELDLARLIRLGLSNEQIADALNISRGAVLTRHHRLRARFELSTEHDILNYLQGMVGAN